MGQNYSGSCLVAVIGPTCSRSNGQTLEAESPSPSINVAPNITLDCFQAVVDDEGYVQGFDRLKITWSIAASTFRLLRAGWLYPKARVTLRAMYGGNSSIRAKLLIELEILLTATGSMAEGTK